MITDPELDFQCNFFIGNAMVKPSDALKDCLILLFQKQKSAWVDRNSEDEPSDPALNTYNAIINKWEPITLKEIEFLFKKSQQDFSKLGKVLYLPPLKKDPHFVPVLSLDCKWNQTPPSAKLKVLLVCRCNYRNCTDEKQIPYGIGFRLETPESINQTETTTDNVGIHDFYHAQLIKKFGKKKLDNKLQICCPNWLPDTQPSFPLPAKCPVSLLFCLIATLYGRKEYSDYRDMFPKQKHYPGYNVRGNLKELDQWIKWEKENAESE